jgi:hypothetical protein
MRSVVIAILLVGAPRCTLVGVSQLEGEINLSRLFRARNAREYATRARTRQLDAGRDGMSKPFTNL